MPCRLQLSPSHIFWQIGCEAFTTDAHIAKIISAKLPLWPARGTWQAPLCIALSNRIFPGQCKLWQIPSSCIMHFLANLPNSRESGRVSLFQLRGMLSDWMMLKLQPSASVISLFPAVTTSSLLSSHIFALFEATSLGLAGNGSTNLTWAQKNYVNREQPFKSEVVKWVCVCVCICSMKERITVWSV